MNTTIFSLLMEEEYKKKITVSFKKYGIYYSNTRIYLLGLEEVGG